MHDIETLVIGAGVIGLAIGRALAMRGRDVMVLERHGLIGSETSARNSEVIHAGIYYRPGSLKAKLCLPGKNQLYAFCAENGIAHKRLGKLIVASNDTQIPELERLHRQAQDTGLDDLVILDRRKLADLEPKLDCVGALWSPSTGIIDSHGYMLALQGSLEAHGGQVVLNADVFRIERVHHGYAVQVRTPDSDETPLTCRELIVSAGHSAPSLMAEIEGANAPKTYLAKGNYFKLQGKAPFSHLIYPAPEPGGLGVHLTLDLQRQARFGPDVEWVDDIDYDVDAGRGDRFYNAIRSYWPGLPDESLIPDYCGIRPKIAGPGEPAADFRIEGPEAHGLEGLVALYGIESPGLTSSLAIGDEVVERLDAGA
ncbi:NAD(P)/FAD-dependent oxidoreductase [uncultured Roseibium sp.]|uniref:NAD(P)/FAD-dependent oxidoreductase n=1 Tax=uncultured Roseibium sp. TaxID=1936171 RepID=UPI0026278F72|nr:NAD(P)/FAD-dependent oxidoreductase [uncultured Roseibium sp.]